MVSMNGIEYATAWDCDSDPAFDSVVFNGTLLYRGSPEETLEWVKRNKSSIKTEWSIWVGAVRKYFCYGGYLAKS